MTEFSQKSAEFYLKEFEALRREVDGAVEHARTVHRNAVVAVGASWAWLFHERDNVPGWAWLLPVLFVVIGYLEIEATSSFLLSCGGYIKSIESAFLSEGAPGGWEHYPKRKTWNSRVRTAFWFLLGVAVIVVACYMDFSRAAK